MINKRNILLLPLLAFIFIFGASKVNALSDSWYNKKVVDIGFTPTTSVGDTYKYVLGGYEYNIEYRSNGLYVNNHLIDSSTYFKKNTWILGCWDSNCSSVSMYYLYTSNNSQNVGGAFCSGLAYSDSLNFPFTCSYLGTNYSNGNRKRTNFTNGVYQNENTSSLTYNNGDNIPSPKYPGYYFLQGWEFTIYGTNARFDMRDSSNNNYFFTSDFDSFPTEINFTKVDIHDTDYFGNDYISMATLNINFDIFDTDNFKYQFSLDSGLSWQDIDINDYVLTLTQNNTILVRILDSNNNYILEIV